MLAGRPGQVQTRSFTYGGYTYFYDHYNPSYTTRDDYRFPVGTVSLYNSTLKSIPLSYTQVQSTTTNWSFTGKLEAEAEFKVSFLASLKASVGIEVATSHQTVASSTVAFKTDVAPGYKTTITRYKAGAYGSGAGVWRKCYQRQPGEPFTFVSYYYETGSAWAVCPNEDHYKVVTTRY